jgi:hypothetical protein
MDFVALELFADAVSPREQIQNVGGRFEIEEPRRFVARNVTGAQNPFAEGGKFLVNRRVNLFRRHG